MDTLPLPPRPNLEQYRKRAKSLVKAAAAPEDDAVRVWASEWLDGLARALGRPVSPFVQASIDRAVADIEERVRETGGQRFTLGSAHYLIARAHGFATWGEFSGHVDRLAGENADPFEAAADAVVNGDLPTLEALLGTDWRLSRTRSAREHRATLLHYTAANGVEDFRQKTPVNAVEVAKALLDRSAVVDAVANTYGGGPAQTTLNLLVSSAHPAAAGVQSELVSTLLQRGAAVDGLEGDGSPLMTALTFGYLEAAEALMQWGPKVTNVMIAAALGHVDVVQRMLVEGTAVAPSLVKLYWLQLSSDPQSHVERAFVWACAFGRTEVVDLLLEHGVEPDATDPWRRTGLDWAKAMRHDEVVKRLTAAG
jgi:hypothetical protein